MRINLKTIAQWIFSEWKQYYAEFNDSVVKLILIGSILNIAFSIPALFAAPYIQSYMEEFMNFKMLEAFQVLIIATPGIFFNSYFLFSALTTYWLDRKNWSNLKDFISLILIVVGFCCFGMYVQSLTIFMPQQYPSTLPYIGDILALGPVIGLCVLFKKKLNLIIDAIA